MPPFGLSQKHSKLARLARGITHAPLYAPRSNHWTTLLGSEPSLRRVAAHTFKDLSRCGESASVAIRTPLVPLEPGGAVGSAIPGCRSTYGVLEGYASWMSPEVLTTGYWVGTAGIKKRKLPSRTVKHSD